MEDCFGREEHFAHIVSCLEGVRAGKGSALIVSGPAGMGKTHLAERFASAADGLGFEVIRGGADPYAQKPFHIFSSFPGFCETVSGDMVFTQFSGLFIMNEMGEILADAGSENPERLASVLSAVRGFVRDSFGGRGQVGLGRLEFGDVKIITECVNGLFLTAIFNGEEHPDMGRAVRAALQCLGSAPGPGKKSLAGSAGLTLNGLLNMKFHVRRSVEGMKLDAERLRVADALLRSLPDKPGGVVIILDDLHWADESSISVLRYMARNLGRRKMMILATVRSDSPAFQTLHEKFMEDGLWTEVVLGGMDAQEVESLVRSVIPGQAIPVEFTERLATRTSGNPFYIREILTKMLADGNIRISGGKSVYDDSAFTVPESLEELVRMRLESLAPDVLMAIEYISCMGIEFVPEIVKSSGLLKAPEKQLAALEKSGFIDLGSGSARFNHAILQDIVYQNIASRWHTAYHRDIGENFERLRPADEVVYELARHFSLAQEHSKTLKYATLAGEKAEGAIAPEQASRYYEAALASAQKLGEKCAVSDLLVRVGDCNMLLGDLGRALEKYSSALESDIEERTKASIRRKTAIVHEKMGDYAASIKDCEAGIKHLGGARERETVMLLLAQASASIRMGITDVAMDIASKALALAREINDEKMIGACMHSLGSFHLMKGEFAKAIECLDMAVETKRNLGDDVGMSASLNNLGIAHYYSGQVQKALECYERSLGIFRKIGDKYGIAAALNNLGGFTQDFGHLRKALEYHLQSLEIKETIGDKYGIVSTLTNLGIVHRNLGELDKAVEFGERGLALSRQINNAKEILLNLNNLGEAHLESLNPGKAEEMFSLALEQSRAFKDLQQETHALRGLAKISLARGDTAGAETHARRALDTALNINSQREEYQSRCTLGGVLRAGGSLDEAAKEFEIALDVFRKSTGNEVEPHIYYEFGLLMKDAGDRAGMSEMLAKARDEFDRHGYVRMVSRIDSELTASG